ncbi:MAG: nucleoside phosphorylase [Alphaproteobacteria bacterium]|nr:nucleoside phosphorylase [Alphaproteobacteria bacterium]MDP6819068.1 nucleoside phosphorylase [Alphaproteobacteria bacterium]
MKKSDLPPILRAKAPGEPSTFRPENLLREARRQLRRENGGVPALCLLDPDGDILSWLLAKGMARKSHSWACYHTELFEFDWQGGTYGIVGNVVGGPFAVLVAEQMFALGCRLIVSVTSAGQIAPDLDLPCFILIDRALRDEGTSYHYLPAGDYADCHAALAGRLAPALEALPFSVLKGATWTTDAPYRETEQAILEARRRGILAVEMEAASLYAFAAARARDIVCFAHVTNQMAAHGADFEKGAEGGAAEALRIMAAGATLLD